MDAQSLIEVITECDKQEITKVDPGIATENYAERIDILCHLTANGSVIVVVVGVSEEPTMDNAPETTLIGKIVRLEPMRSSHIQGLTAAASAEPSLYRWSPVPQGAAEVDRYVDAALAWKRNGTAVPYVTFRISDGAIVGSTRFWNLERWSWPDGHVLHGRSTPDACEIGYTWLTQSAIRTAVNTEAKLLMLSHAFDAWQVLRVCFHADARNQRSRTALERIGATFEGILRSHRLAVDLRARDSARYSILAAEWPDVKERLRWLLERE